MKIDIDRLSEAELIDLNNRIVERLRFLGQMRTHSKMLEFKIGERVTFPAGGSPVPDWDGDPIQQENGDRHYRGRTAPERLTRVSPKGGG